MSGPTSAGLEMLGGSLKRVLLLCAAGAWLTLGAGCVQGGGLAQVCRVAPGSDSAELGFREVHSFGKNYEVFQLTVTLDDCVLFQSEDTSVLDQPQFELPPKPLTAGEHQLRVFTKFKSGFSADMHDYEWIDERTMRIQLGAGTTHTLVIQRSEVMDRDPRKRMQTEVSLE